MAVSTSYVKSISNMTVTQAHDAMKRHAESVLTLLGNRDLDGDLDLITYDVDAMALLTNRLSDLVNTW